MATFTFDPNAPIPLVSAIPVEGQCAHACHAEGFQVENGFWVLVVEEGSATVKCELCRCSPDAMGGYPEMLGTVKDVPVRLQFAGGCTGHYESSWCDCDWWIELSPRRERHGC